MGQTMSILPHFLTFLVGSVLFLFVFWKRTREDYSSEMIFATGTLFVSLMALGSLAFQLFAGFVTESAVFSPNGLWFWGGLGGFALAFAISTKRFKIRAVETFEACSLGASFWLLILGIVNLAFPLIIFLGLLFALFFLFEKNYKRFGWYKSGKAGFSGLAVTSIFFSLRGAAALIAPSLFSLTGKLDLVPSAVVAFLLLFSLYNLSEGY